MRWSLQDFALEDGPTEMRIILMIGNAYLLYRRAHASTARFTCCRCRRVVRHHRHGLDAGRLINQEHLHPYKTGDVAGAVRVLRAAGGDPHEGITRAAGTPSGPTHRASVANRIWSLWLGQFQ